MSEAGYGIIVTLRFDLLHETRIEIYINVTRAF